MTFDPNYGQTGLPFDEVDALTPKVRDALEAPISKAAVYDLEQALEDHVAQQLLLDVLEGRLVLGDVLSDNFLRHLHESLYADIWVWAGTYRRHLLNIGVDPVNIATELRATFETIAFRWEHTRDWSPRELGVAVHAECVRIHPFVDGNGRSTRLLADLVFVAAQASDEVEMYDWAFDKTTYIDLLRQFDVTRDPKPLAAFIPVYIP